MQIDAVDQMKKKVISILVIVGLAVVIALLTVRTRYKPPPYGVAPRRWRPVFDLADYVILFLASMVAGVFLVELESIFFGWIGSVSLSFVISTVYISLYNWFVLEWDEVFSIYPWGFENIFFVALVNVFAITLFGNLFVFLGLFAGGVACDLTGIGKKILNNLEW